MIGWYLVLVLPGVLVMDTVGAIAAGISAAAAFASLAFLPASAPIWFIALAY